MKTFEEFEKEVAEKLMENEISPEEFVQMYNDFIKQESDKYNEPVRPHEHI